MELDDCDIRMTHLRGIGWFCPWVVIIVTEATVCLYRVNGWTRHSHPQDSAKTRSDLLLVATYTLFACAVVLQQLQYDLG